MTAPSIAPCPTPGHAHPMYVEPRYSDSRYVTIAYASQEDAEAGRPRSVTYHPTRALAETMRAQADGPVVSVYAL